MRLLSVTYLPYADDRAVTRFLREKIAEYEHYWVRQGRLALVSSNIDPQSLFESLKPHVGEFDTLVVSTVIDPLCFSGEASDELRDWIDRFSAPN